jgi:hypothetical protein
MEAPDKESRLLCFSKRPVLFSPLATQSGFIFQNKINDLSVSEVNFSGLQHSRVTGSQLSTGLAEGSSRMDVSRHLRVA